MVRGLLNAGLYDGKVLSMVSGIGAGALALLLVTLPLAHVTALRSASWLLSVGCAIYLFLTLPGKQPKVPPLLWIFFIWLSAALLSLAASKNVSVALALIWQEVIKGTLIFYSAYFIARSRQNGHVWFFSASLALSLVAATAIIARLLYGQWRAVGPVPALGDYATSALTLLPLVALPLFSSWRPRLGKKALLCAGLASMLGMVAGMLTLSRAFLMVAAIMLFCAALAWTWRREPGRKASFLWLAGGLCLLVLFAAMVAQQRGLNLFSFSNRSVIYASVLNHLKEAPVTGFGYGHESMKEWYSAHMSETGLFHAHNIVLSYAEQMGVPGVLAVFSIFGGLAWRFFRYVSDPDGFRAGLAVLGLALVVGIFAKNNLDIFFTRHNLLLFFLCCGLILGSVENKCG